MGRITVIDHKDRLEISVRILRNLYVVVPLLLASVIWLVSFLFLLSKVPNEYHMIIEMGLAGTLLVWIGAGFLLISTLYWIYYGRERILVGPETICTVKSIHLYKRKRYYALKEVSGIRIGSEMYKVRRKGAWLDDQRNVLQFDTAHKMVTFGRGLQPEEVEFILLTLASSPFLSEDQFESPEGMERKEAGPRARH